MSEPTGFEITLQQPYEQAIETVTAALKVEGFGILTRIDVRSVLKEKIGADFRPYVILGACNPHLSHRALSVDPLIGLMLPCNVTVEANPSGGSIVRIANPAMIVQFAAQPDSPEILAVAKEAQRKMQNVVASLKG